ncbi:MAG: hypothetical protein WC777_03820 [Candidatus Gracilibacteria bacterium]
MSNKEAVSGAPEVQTGVLEASIWKVLLLTPYIGEAQTQGVLQFLSREITINGKSYLIEQRSEHGPGYSGYDLLTVTDTSSGGVTVKIGVAYVAVDVGGERVYTRTGDQVVGDVALAACIVDAMVSDFTDYGARKHPVEATKNIASQLGHEFKRLIDGASQD